LLKQLALDCDIDWSGSMNKNHKIWIVIGVLIALGILIFFSLRQSASAQSLEKFPTSGARNVLMAIDYNLRRHGVNMNIENFNLLNADTVEDARQRILKHSTIILLSGAEQTVIKFKTLQKHGFPTKSDEIALNKAVQIGDYHISINLHLIDGSHIYTEFAISPNGTRVSGVFLDGSRVASASLYSKAKEGQQCETRVIGRYLYGADAEWIRTCVDFTCQKNNMNSCIVSENTGNTGFMYTMSIDPPAGTQGTITGNKCYGTAKYKLEFALKSLGFSILKEFGADIELKSTDGFRSHTVNGYCRITH
jgi:hypothetical protein